MILTTLLCALLAADKNEPLAPPPETPASPPVLAAPRANVRAMGAAATPAALPGGASALFAFIGAPDLAFGYRQGFEVAELEARVSFNYLELSGVAEVGGRVGVVRRGSMVLAPGAFLGVKLDSGNRYFDRANFTFIGVRPRVDFTASFEVAETVQVFCRLDLPVSLAANVVGTQFVPTFGGGAEFHVGGGFSLLASAHGGIDVVKEPLGVTQVRPGWAIRLGLGYRLF